VGNGLETGHQVARTLEAPSCDVRACVRPASKEYDMSGKNKWTSGSGRWKSSSTGSAQLREPPRAVEPVEPPKSMTLAERLPTLTDSELLALQANAVRVAANASDKKAPDAEALLPLLEAELAERKVQKAVASVERKKDMAEKRASAKARRIATAAAEAESAAEDEAERE
jgi:hypothetical protein